MKARNARAVVLQVKYKEPLSLKLNARSAGKARKGWKKLFRAMAEHKDDELLDNICAQTNWDKNQWRWQ